MKPPFDNKRELFIWGPIPIRHYYESAMSLMLGEGHFKKKYGLRYHWPISVLIFRNDKCVWINDYAKLWEVGGRNFTELMLPVRKQKEVKEAYGTRAEELIGIENEIDKTILSKLSDNEFAALWERFHYACKIFLVEGILPEIAAYGGEKLLEKLLSKEILDKDKLREAMTILTAPEELSFYQKEEIALSKTRSVEKHAKDYCWIKNSYYGAQKLPVDFFKKRKKELPEDVGLKFEKHLSEVKEEKMLLQKEFGLSNEVMNVARVLCNCIAWQDDRKSKIFRFIWYKDILLDEMLKRRNWEKDLVVSLTGTELLDYFSNKVDYSKEVKERHKGFAIILTNTQKVLNANEANELWEYYLGKENDAVRNVSELKGTVVSQGKEQIVTGKARILLDPHNLEGIEEGEVLIAPMTSPEYVFAMKKAIAIVTDTGGLTSHAAIVSRELKKACIVGTKYATKILSDGDLVEVNANTGIVRIIKSKVNE
jgi:phosphohistidine swiveling domain-containing protein